MNGEADSGTWLLGLDAGLTTLKAALVSTEGAEVAVVSRDTPRDAPAPEREETDVEELWATVVETVAETIASGPAAPNEIAAVGVAGHGHGLYALDADGAPVHPGIRSTDNRAQEVISEWAADGTVDTIHDRLGYEPFGADPISLLTWLREHDPDSYGRINSVLFCKDYLSYRLTDCINTDEMEASVFTNQRTGEYATDLLHELGLDRTVDALPPVVNSWDVCGKITEEAAAETGLEAGTPVATGLHDVGAVALGTGAHEAGDGVLIVGTWGQSIVIDDTSADRNGSATDVDDALPGCDEAVADRSSKTSGITRAYLDGKRLRYKGNRSAAASLDWFVDNFGEQWRRRAEAARVNEYAMYDRVVEGVAPGADGVLFHPYLRGSTDDPKASGGFYGLTSDHDPEHLLRAVYEGVAIAGVEQLTDIVPAGGLNVLRLSGGGARSDVWPGIFADVSEQPVVVPTDEEAGIKGAAICAAIAVDVYPNHRTAVDRMVTVECNHEPDPKSTAVYRDRQETFNALRSALRPLWNDLAGVGKD